MAALLALGLMVSTAAVAADIATCPPPPLALGAVSFTISPGSSDCGGPGLSTPPSPPFSGELLDAAGAKVADLGQGCFYLGGGRATSLPAARLPDGSTSLLDVSSVDGLSLGLSASRGTGPANCTRGAGPLRHCVNGNPGTDGRGLCGSDADCGGGVGNCQRDANCYFGAPIPVPNATPALTACAVSRQIGAMTRSAETLRPRSHTPILPSRLLPSGCGCSRPVANPASRQLCHSALWIGLRPRMASRAAAERSSGVSACQPTRFRHCDVVFRRGATGGIPRSPAIAAINRSQS